MNFRQRQETGQDETDLAILAALEERRESDKSDIIIPHHGISTLIFRKLERVLEHYERSISLIIFILFEFSSPSKLSLPVFSKKDFFSLLYGICLRYSAI